MEYIPIVRVIAHTNLSNVVKAKIKRKMDTRLVTTKESLKTELIHM